MLCDKCKIVKSLIYIKVEKQGDVVALLGVALEEHCVV